MEDSLTRYEIRGVTLADEAGLLQLASFLDSVNLPHDAAEMRPLVEHSDRSFSGTEGDPRRRTYVFVLYDRLEDRAIGTSMVVGQLGRRDAPYIFFEVRHEERYSHTLDKHFVHKVLSMGYSYNGPTEIGGLVMHPDYRRAGARLGMQISYVRFLWLAMHRADFQSYVLAELMPPLAPDGSSFLWEAVGHRFTDMTYRDADRLSRRNKEFIRGLFPDGDIYATLLPAQAQEVIGQVGPQTRGVEKLLTRIGFRYVDRVDPIDGGPHFVARTDEITLVQASRRVVARAAAVPGSPRALVAREYDAAPWFRAFATPFRPEADDGAVELPGEVLEALDCADGDSVWLLPLA